ncbi:MAG: hypothetical protein JKX97_01660, partial [Candidatus Lindowbacteria bacterium]|nr:hypothetical protein [Candidatus Lindowbacteria bacterium]
VAKEDGTCGIIGEGDDSFYSVVGMCREIAEELATRANAGQILANRNLHDSNRMFQYKTMSSFPLKGRPETIDFSEVLS